MDSAKKFANLHFSIKHKSSELSTSTHTHRSHAQKVCKARGWALLRVHNSRRPLITLAFCDPVTLTFWHQNHISCRYPNVIPYTKIEHFGIIVFELSCRQTDRQTDAIKRFTPATMSTWVITFITVSNVASSASYLQTACNNITSTNKSKGFSDISNLCP